MLREEVSSETSIDTKTAEQAMALAIRLQQASGDRVPIAELRKTAEEAGIDKVYLESAIKQVTKRREF